MEFTPEWIGAIATVVVAIVASIGFLFNAKILNEMKRGRIAQSKPVLDFGMSYSNHRAMFTVKNIGHGLAMNIQLNVEFEGWSTKPIKSEPFDLAIDGRFSFGTGAIDLAIVEHGSKITSIIECTYEDVYKNKTKINKKQKWSDKIF